MPIEEHVVNWNLNKSAKLIDSTNNNDDEFNSGNTSSLWKVHNYSINTTLSLMDIFVRKLNKIKPKRTFKYENNNLQQLNIIQLKFVDAFENVLIDVANEFNVPIEDFNFDPIVAMKCIADGFRRGRTTEEISTDLIKTFNIKDHYELLKLLIKKLSY